MENILLATKLFIPRPRPGLVSRPRLLKRMDSILDNSLTLISASAGFGKTTILSEWIHGRQPNLHAAWLSLDAEDNDPVRFWDYFIAALKTIQRDIGDRPLSWLHATPTPPFDAILTMLINDLSKLTTVFVLIMDDYHFIHSTPINDGLTFVLEHVPPPMHLIIATRADPQIPLAHFRGKGTLLEIGVEDLRFANDETAALLKELGVPALSSENIEALNARTEGWVAGLKMAALSLTKQPDIQGFLTSFTGSQHYIMDYLLEDVFETQPETVQEFLLKTSILETLTAPLCETVSGVANGREMLFYLERENLFIVSLDDSRIWYRYHHLFDELLRHRLETALGKDQVDSLHRLAAAWYEGNGLAEDAIHHWLAIKDWEKTIKLVSGTQREGMSLVNWLNQVPRELLITDMPLYVRYTRSVFAVGRYDDAEALIIYAETTAPELARQWTAVLRTSLGMVRHDNDYIEKYARQALELLPPNSPGRANVCMALGSNCISQYRFAEAEPLLEEAYDISRITGDIYSMVYSLTYLGAMACARGKRRQAQKLLEEAIGEAGSNPIAGAAHAYLAYFVFYEWNDLTGAESHLALAAEMSRMMKGAGALPFVFNYLAHVLIARGDNEGARTALKRSDQVLTEIRDVPFYIAENAAYHVALALAEGNVEETSRWLDRLSQFENALPPDIPYRIRCLLWETKKEDPFSESQKASYEQFRRNGIENALIQMNVHWAIKSTGTGEGLGFLSKAFILAKPEGYIRTFVDEGMALAPWLHKAIAHGIEPEYACKLLDIIEAEELRKKSRKSGAFVPSVSAQMLSERELEVLTLLAEEISNEQIAQKLNISLSTVKTHVHHILDKLTVRDRSQAVFRAREIKLI